MPTYASGRRTVSATTPSQLQMATPTFHSPHSFYPSQQVDLGRPNGGNSLLSDPFPSTPYTSVSNLFMSQGVRNTLITPHFIRQARAVTHVTSSKFAPYTTIYNLENEDKPSVLIPKISTQVYQTTARYTGKDILLRRIVKTSITAEDCKVVYETLRHYRHPNLVPLTNIFTTDEFIMGSSDVIMEYRFMPGAKSIYDALFTENNRATEGLLWSFTCQMVGLLRSFHETLIPLRGLHWSKIIYIETTGRFYFTGLGLVDLLEPNLPSSMLHLMMKQDIQAFGFILFQIATRNVDAKPENFINKHPLVGFSSSFWELIKICLEGNADAAQLCHALGERISMEVGHQEGHADFLLSQCVKEIHNGRLMRLMIKLNFVLESLHDIQYSTDSQRYALRLFSQFVFNQVDDQNRVHVDWGHAYHCLNKLDCGSEETIQLIGNDANTTVLVISYADLRVILDGLFEQLQQLASQGGNGTDIDNQTFIPASPGSA
ncbi:unnamed protein product [Phytomonas sp. EM1]|nr:unnamed protein product [Phytomonas sp. EM1]|eukprot:CCW62741.1 unnamed protein product [Phytomonas sp. isolate EM1]